MFLTEFFFDPKGGVYLFWNDGGHYERFIKECRAYSDA